MVFLLKYCSWHPNKQLGLNTQENELGKNVEVGIKRHLSVLCFCKALLNIYCEVKANFTAIFLFTEIMLLLYFMMNSEMNILFILHSWTFMCLICMKNAFDIFIHSFPVTALSLLRSCVPGAYPGVCGHEAGIRHNKLIIAYELSQKTVSSIPVRRMTIMGDMWLCDCLVIHFKVSACIHGLGSEVGLSMDWGAKQAQRVYPVHQILDMCILNPFWFPWSNSHRNTLIHPHTVSKIRKTLEAVWRCINEKVYIFCTQDHVLCKVWPLSSKGSQSLWWKLL